MLRLFLTAGKIRKKMWKVSYILTAIISDVILNPKACNLQNLLLTIKTSYLSCSFVFWLIKIPSNRGKKCCRNVSMVLWNICSSSLVWVPIQIYICTESSICKDYEHLFPISIVKQDRSYRLISILSSWILTFITVILV